MIYETLKKLSESQRKLAMHIYKDEKTGQIIEELLSNDMAGSALTHETMRQYKNSAKEIRKSIFGN
jgi:hypothetical protein